MVGGAAIDFHIDCERQTARLPGIQLDISLDSVCHSLPLIDPVLCLFTFLSLKFYFNYVYACVMGIVHMSVGARGGQRCGSPRSWSYRWL